VADKRQHCGTSMVFSFAVEPAQRNISSLRPWLGLSSPLEIENPPRNGIRRLMRGCRKWFRFRCPRRQTSPKRASRQPKPEIAISADTAPQSRTKRRFPATGPTDPLARFGHIDRRIETVPPESSHKTSVVGEPPARMGVLGLRATPPEIACAMKKRRLPGALWR
jgi:hypothetical protein